MSENEKNRKLTSDLAEARMRAGRLPHMAEYDEGEWRKTVANLARATADLILAQRSVAALLTDDADAGAGQEWNGEALLRKLFEEASPLLLAEDDEVTFGSSVEMVRQLVDRARVDRDRLEAERKAWTETLEEQRRIIADLIREKNDLLFERGAAGAALSSAGIPPIDGAPCVSERVKMLVGREIATALAVKKRLGEEHAMLRLDLAAIRTTCQAIEKRSETLKGGDR